MTAAASWDPYKVDGDNSSWGYHRFDREAQSLRAHWTTTDMIYPLELPEDVLLCLVSAISTLPEPPLNQMVEYCDLITCLCQ